MKNFLVCIGLVLSANLVAELNPCEKAFGEIVAAQKQLSPGKPLEQKTIEELREGTKVFLQFTTASDSVTFRDSTLEINPGVHLPLRIFNEHLPAETPTLLFFPGCAYLFDLFEVNSTICSRIAEAGNIKVVLIQFRLAPEHPMPCSVLDGIIAVKAISKRVEGDLYVGGWCTGAHCAAVAGRVLMEEGSVDIKRLVLLGGLYDYLETTHEFDDYERKDPLLNRSLVSYLSGKFYGMDDFSDPMISPIYGAGSLPPVTLICGEYDAYRNDTEAYYRKLTQEGAEAEKIILPGQTHNTVAMRKVLFEGKDPAVVIAEVINRDSD